MGQFRAALSQKQALPSSVRGTVALLLSLSPPSNSRGLCTNTSKGGTGDSPRADPGWSFLPLLLHQVELSCINKQWWQCKWGFRLREPSVQNPPVCLKAEAGFKKKKGFLHPLKAELKLWGGSCVIWGRAWDRMEPGLPHFQHRESWLFPVPAAVLFPLPATGNDNLVKHRTFLDYSMVSKSRGHLFPSCSFTRRKQCSEITPYWLTGGLVEGDFLSPYKLCTVKYIIYFLQKSISPPEYVPHRPGKKFKL